MGVGCEYWTYVDYLDICILGVDVNIQLIAWLVTNTIWLYIWTNMCKNFLFYFLANRERVKLRNSPKFIDKSNG